MKLADNIRGEFGTREIGLAYANYANEYRKQAAAGASPVGLIVMLYDGALRFMEAGKAAVIAKDLPKQNDHLQRAQKIVLHLMATLNMEKGGHIATNLMSLYMYVVDELVKANIHDQTEPIENAMRTMSELRQGWAELEQKTKTVSQETAVAA